MKSSRQDGKLVNVLLRKGVTYQQGMEITCQYLLATPSMRNCE